MKKLLSLPPNLVDCFHEVEEVEREEYFCTSDPVGSKLGSGGGTCWLLRACHQAEAAQDDFISWLGREKRVLLHAGGQSRRLPSYAPCGKVLTPVPIFRWKRGQRITQNLLQLQLPLYEKILNQAPDSLHTLIASGDVCLRAGRLQPIPEADVVCYGLWADAELAKNHGVFMLRRDQPTQLDFMLQKPSTQQLGKLMHTHLCLMDIGVWLLSDRAVERLCQRSSNDGEITCYDLYGQFGCALGQHPTQPDPLLSDLSVAILPLEDGAFYHYGTSREMISSTVALQNVVFDQRAIMKMGVKPHPSIFIQNAHCEWPLTADNENTWIENAWVGSRWTLARNNIITGVPRNDWAIELSAGMCVDIVPIGEKQFALRPYGFNDAFRGPLTDGSVQYLSQPVTEWLRSHQLTADEIPGHHDLQAAEIFPLLSDLDEMGRVLRWMLGNEPDDEARAIYLRAEHLSANTISDRANLLRLKQQRQGFLRSNLQELADNHRQSIFYQTNLADLAERFHRLGVGMPAELPDSEPLLKRINDQLFRSRLLTLGGKDGEQHRQQGFALLREGLTSETLRHKQMPKLSVYSDQIVWGRSPVRIDVAGGWTDTPPYCLTNGGNVVNLAIELNGQPPLQTYVKPCAEYKIVLRSIDLGASETIHTYEELLDYQKVGSPFSIPKAALCLAGFCPQFCGVEYASLEEQLRDFGSGIEVTLLSAIPAGSGLGTSSILASTVLGSISDFCGLGWDSAEICNRTLVLEQLLTTGGGWQDQYGGVLHGIKLLRTGAGFEQTPEIKWLPDTLYTDPECAACHLLFYTGITRTAKHILAEIVTNMFLYETHTLDLLQEMKEHAIDLYNAILHNDFTAMGRLVAKTWQQNQLLDAGTNPAAVAAITREIHDLCLGYKLPGAGGGGYLYMIAKDPQAAMLIRQRLTALRVNDKARFVDMRLSRTGLQISRS